MARKFKTYPYDTLADDKALAIAAYGESVASYRYIVLAEKARSTHFRAAFEAMALEERGHRDLVQRMLDQISPGSGFFLANEDKAVVCVGPRLVDARDDARFDEALRLVIGSEKRTASFYHRYASHAKHTNVRELFAQLAAEGIEHVRRLRILGREAGREISEPCPMDKLA
ncbi:MAG: ferritin family protein [Phycisphaerae bacterium]